MNNKRLGNSFEVDVCKLLANAGYWVHFIVPDARGAQPFDIIAVKDKIAYAIECKTLTISQRYFSINRLEENQKMAFDLWMQRGNTEPIIAIKYGDNKILFARYLDLIMNEGKIDMIKSVLYQHPDRIIEVNGGIYNIYTTPKLKEIIK